MVRHLCLQMLCSIVLASAAVGCAWKRPSAPPVARTADASATPPPSPPTALPSAADGHVVFNLVLAESNNEVAPRRIRIVPAWGGANRGAARSEGWTAIPLLKSAAHGIELSTGGSSRSVASGTLPAGQWDRVFIAVDSVDAVNDDPSDQDGGEPSFAPIESHIEPIAFGFDLSDRVPRTIDIELVILDRPSQPGHWRIFVKDSRLSLPEEE